MLITGKSHNVSFVLPGTISKCLQSTLSLVMATITKNSDEGTVTTSPRIARPTLIHIFFPDTQSNTSNFFTFLLLSLTFVRFTLLLIVCCRFLFSGHE